VAQRRAHVQRPARVAFEEHIVASQMHLSQFARGLQLFQMTIAEFALLILFIADGLRVNDSLGNRRSCNWARCDFSGVG